MEDAPDPVSPLAPPTPVLQLRFLLRRRRICSGRPVGKNDKRGAEERLEQGRGQSDLRFSRPRSALPWREFRSPSSLVQFVILCLKRVKHGLVSEYWFVAPEESDMCHSRRHSSDFLYAVAHGSSFLPHGSPSSLISA